MSVAEDTMDLIVAFLQVPGRVTTKINHTKQLNSDLGNSLEDSFTASK